jgi:ABC-type sugar transport system ATPase subunit
MAQIRLERLRKEYGKTIAVNDVTIDFPTSAVTCLLGPSGCGKTTLMRMIAGLESPTAGEIYFDEERVTNQTPQQRNIGMVFQYPVVYKGISVYRNIELPLLEDKLPEAERRKRIEEVAQILGLENVLNRNVSSLDNAGRQKVAVGRAVARQPQIILFDEPITNVDASSRVQLKTALKRLSKLHDQTIIYVTHDQTEAMTLADEIALMQDGVIVQRDNPRALYNYPNDVFGGWFLGNPGMNFVEYAVGSTAELAGPLFAQPIRFDNKTGEQRVSVGIRPEHILVHLQAADGAVRGKVTRKSIVVGGQYLLFIQVEDQTLKAKVSAEIGQAAGENIWMECPLDNITLFGANGTKIATELVAATPVA